MRIQHLKGLMWLNKTVYQIKKNKHQTNIRGNTVTEQANKFQLSLLSDRYAYRLCAQLDSKDEELLVRKGDVID